MMVTRREFLLGSSAVGAMALWGGVALKVVTTPGFRGFAEALAYARTRTGDGVLVRWVPADGCQLAGGSSELRLVGVDRKRDHELLRMVETGHPERGGWRLTVRGIGMEFMLRMELLGPVCSTMHPRAGEAWSPVLRVGGVRRLMRRMLEEGGVESAMAADPGPDCGGEWLTRAPQPPEPDLRVSGRDFVDGQRMGIAEALADRSGEDVKDVLASARFRQRLERELALPG